MKFRPCIDIHDGKVKQIVGGSLRDGDRGVEENFTSGMDSSYYAQMYKDDGLTGGHIILLNQAGSPQYGDDVRQAELALAVYPGGLQVGGGIHAGNAGHFLRAGASHVIVTSYAFREGKIQYANLEKLREAVGKEHIVLDVSCRKKEESYYIVTDRWQKFTDVTVTEETMLELADFCGEFLVHAVDVEGKCAGIETGLVGILALAAGKVHRPVTYAGGISSWQDIAQIRAAGAGRIDFTVGSALDLFGGKLPYRELCKM